MADIYRKAATADNVASIHTVRNDYPVPENRKEFRSERTGQAAGTSSRHTTLGILWALYGVLMLTAGVWTIVFNQTLTLMWGAIISHVPDPFTWMDAFHAYLAVMVIMAFVAAAVSFLAAFTLMQGAEASRMWGLIAAAFGLLTGPIGIALGVFTVAILFPLRDARQAA